MKVLTSESLSHLVDKVKELIPGVASKDKPGLVPNLPNETNLLLRSDGTWGKLPGNFGMIDLEVDDSDGHLYMYYDDSTDEPNIAIEQDGPLSGHLVWTYDTED